MPGVYSRERVKLSRQNPLEWNGRQHGREMNVFSRVCLVSIAGKGLN